VIDWSFASSVCPGNSATLRLILSGYLSIIANPVTLKKATNPGHERIRDRLSSAVSLAWGKDSRYIWSARQSGKNHDFSRTNQTCMKTSLMNPCQIEWEENFTISSRCEEVAHVIDVVLNRLRQSGWHENDSFAVHVALQESLSNAIKHGNRYDPMRRVFVSCRLTKQEIEISVRDEGSGFDPSKVPDPTLPENLHFPTGRGLKLITGFMDYVSFRDGGREIVMRRLRRDSSASQATS